MISWRKSHVAEKNVLSKKILATTTSWRRGPDFPYSVSKAVWKILRGRTKQQYKDFRLCHEPLGQSLKGHETSLVCTSITKILTYFISARSLDSLGGGNILRSIEAAEAARNLDSIGGGNILRQLDSIGGGNILRDLERHEPRHPTSGFRYLKRGYDPLR